MKAAQVRATRAGIQVKVTDPMNPDQRRCLSSLVGPFHVYLPRLKRALFTRTQHFFLTIQTPGFD